jgi:hypothetical protein
MLLRAGEVPDKAQLKPLMAVVRVQDYLDIVSGTVRERVWSGYAGCKGESLQNQGISKSGSKMTLRMRTARNFVETKRSRRGHLGISHRPNVFNRLFMLLLGASR